MIVVNFIPFFPFNQKRYFSCSVVKKQKKTRFLLNTVPKIHPLCVCVSHGPYLNNLAAHSRDVLFFLIMIIITIPSYLALCSTSPIEPIFPIPNNSSVV